MLFNAVYEKDIAKKIIGAEELNEFEKHLCFDNLDLALKLKAKLPQKLWYPTLKKYFSAEIRREILSKEVSLLEDFLYEIG